MRLVPAAIAALLLLASTSSVAGDGGGAAEVRSGETPEAAIVIDAKSSAEGVPLEYRWIERNLPDSKIERQALVNNGGKIYDRFDVVLPSGEKRSVYFDITKYFGKRP
ncbi:hypothetical protein FZO89_10900 [Luteimonas viscosa]|uniref:Uncharacterized protein n=1 Tax=Luteimonas viscosa TaxID=1132694 RepID=A0A5D4XRY5_9GAMM|nr:hypothetical protein [Luteimonas viscosa]TYT26725.1 hypothetical protein FZO89_10900 [Luteimonas viscosa]